MQRLLDEASKYENEIISVRRTIHENPELGHKETQTAKLVAEKMRSLGLDVKEGVGGTGVVALLRGKGGGKVVALRADMDALPLEEMTGLEFKSKVKGVMHACGHDTHVAMLLGAATLLVDHQNELKGSVKFIFQPAEETDGIQGAQLMIDDGVLENPKVDYVFGLHIWAGLPSRVFGVKSGPMLAASDFFKIRVIGKGGHGSGPHETIDPVFIAAQLIVAIQGISSRMMDPVEPFVISVCSVHAGTKSNIIPDDVTLEGTIRTLDSKMRTRALKLMREIATSLCKTFGASCQVEFSGGTNPVTKNDPRTTARAVRTLKRIRGAKTVEIKPVLGGEDFAFYLQLVPGTFYFLGTKDLSKGCIYPNHSSHFIVDEAALKYGAVSLAALALDFTGSE